MKVLLTQVPDDNVEEQQRLSMHLDSSAAEASVVVCAEARLNA